MAIPRGRSEFPPVTKTRNVLFTKMDCRETHKHGEKLRNVQKQQAWKARTSQTSLGIPTPPSSAAVTTDLAGAETGTRLRSLRLEKRIHTPNSPNYIRKIPPFVSTLGWHPKLRHCDNWSHQKPGPTSIQLASCSHTLRSLGRQSRRTHLELWLPMLTEIEQLFAWQTI